MKITEKKITRTINFVSTEITVYHKDSKSIETVEFVVPYHGEEITEYIQKYMPNDVKVVDVEVKAEFDKVYAIDERDFLKYGYPVEK